MAVSSIKSSGGDYTSLLSWQADKAGDLVTATEGETAQCYNFEDTGGACQFGGWTCDATYFITVEAVDDHGGKWSTSAYRRNNVLKFNYNGGAEFAQIKGIQVSTISATANGFHDEHNSPGDEITISKCIVYTTAATPSSSCGFYGDYSDLVVQNCLTYDAYYGFRRNRNNANSKAWFLNCTAHNTTVGFQSDTVNGTSIAINCVANGNTTDYSSNWDSGTSNNVSEDGTEPGTSGVTGAVTFVDEGADDFHLDAADGYALDAGTDLSAYTYPFSDDIDGDTRTRWSSGIDDGPPSAATRRVMVVS